MNAKRSAGFTLIEVMVVVVIIGVLATLVLPRVLNRTDDAYQAAVKSDIQALTSAFKLYKLDNFNYPTTDQGIEALVSQPGGAKNWKQGGYVDQLPTDPWGNPYQYLSPGRNGEFDVWSYGADGQPGGEGANADIGNWVNPQG